MGYTGMCSTRGFGFSASLVINRASILAILVINSVWFFYSSLELDIFFEEATFSSFLIRLSTKALYNVFNRGLSRGVAMSLVVFFHVPMSSNQQQQMSLSYFRCHIFAVIFCYR